MNSSILVTILAILTKIWQYLKLAACIFRVIGNVALFVSRLPGDIAWGYIGNIPEKQQQKVFKITVYVVAGLVSLGIIVFIFKWVFGY